MLLAITYLMWKMVKLKSWAINLGMVVTSLVVGVAIAELGVRIAGLEGLKKFIGTHADFSPTFYTVSDPVFGWSYKPNISGWWQDEGEAFLEFNNDGLRGAEISLDKPDNTIRIAVLGDSFTAAVQVPLEQTFVKRIEAELADCEAFSGKQIEAINFGVDGYGTAQQLLTLEQKVRKYQPDIVILAFFIGNDVIDNSRKLETNHFRPFFVYKNGQLVLDNSFNQLSINESNRYMITMVDRLPAWLVNNLRILQLIKKIEVDNKKRNLTNYFEKLNANIFVEPPNSIWGEAWEITEELLVKISQEVKQQEAEFLLFTIGTSLQVNPHKPSRENYMKSFNIEDLLYPSKRLQKLGESNNFPVLDLVEPFQNYAEENQVCLHGFENRAICVGHWNGKGHKLAAEIITEKLCQ
ncbi:MAG: SGNH/GDSL hydrolase family protein [Microcoleaceae cyanobacterium MO_207.B10]|nr:SGNH/GDSL hydrolase family protein [Microcoleaceae cyanobacterium MO_207.B10]